MAEKENIISNKLWLSISSAAKLFGVQQKTIRRAIKKKQIAYVVEGNRYNVEVGSLLHWAYQSKKLRNKLISEGVGKFVKEWKAEFIA
jgi:excisionase family DNA binding protein